MLQVIRDVRKYYDKLPLHVSVYNKNLEGVGCYLKETRIIETTKGVLAGIIDVCHHHYPSERVFPVQLKMKEFLVAFMIKQFYNKVFEDPEQVCLLSLLYIFIKYN